MADPFASDGKHVLITGGSGGLGRFLPKLSPRGGSNACGLRGEPKCWQKQFRAYE
jgi:hypothetical protein